MTHAKHTSLSDRDATCVVVLCWLAYFTAYLGRLNYSACLLGIIDSLGITNAQAGTVGSFFFVAYGAGQAVNGILSTRVDSIKTIAIGLGLSAVVNACMPFAGTVLAMQCLWFVNGAIQSVLWANLIAIYADLLSDRQLPRAIVVLHTTGAVGSFGVYLIASVALEFVDWTLVFYLAAGLLAVMALVWYRGMAALKRRTGPDTASEPVKQSPAVKIEPKPQRRIAARLFAAGMLVALVACVMNGAVRDGINLWLPPYLSGTFQLSSSFAVFASSVVPVVQVSGAFFARLLLRRVPRLFSATAAFSTLSLSSMLLLLAFGRISVLLSCLLFALAAMSMSAVNALMLSFWPISLRKHGLASLATGLLNTAVYVGSALASFGLGALADCFGWNSIALLLAGGSLMGVLACLAGARRYPGAEAAGEK